MPRTTVNLDSSVFQQLKRRQQVEGRRLSELVNQLLARALAETESAPPSTRPLRWTSGPMVARVDLEDKDALHRALDGR